MGGVVNGQPVDAPTTSAAFLEKNAADSMPFALTLNSTATSDGATVTSSQAEHNSIAFFIGKALNAAYNALPSWVTNNRGTSGDNIFARVKAIDTAFDPSTGHKHSGSAGDAPKILVTALDTTGGSNGQVYQANGTGGGAWANASGGGGGGSLEWLESTNAPSPTIDNSSSGIPLRTYLFQSGLGQSLYSAIKVPSSYAGAQIFIKLEFFSPDSSGTALIQSVATLIRSGTDLISSTTNQRTSSNAAVTLGAGTVNIPQSLSIDLTDSAGKINSVSVSAGDLILVQITRGTDTATSDLHVPVYGAEVKTS